MVDYVRLPAAGLTEVAARIFQAAGGARDEALEIATNLVGANLAGHDSHGLFRIPRYLDWLKRGYHNFGRRISVISENAVMASLDGGRRFLEEARATLRQAEMAELIGKSRDDVGSIVVGYIL
jgi:LDH2 family malate/lactate/ureidoglycolate dehydrogenase